MSSNTTMPGVDFIRPHWPASARVRGLVTTRDLPGLSQTPFDRFNLGGRCGDDPEAVAQNQVLLRRWADLPNEPHWLTQVHGTEVHRVLTPVSTPEPVIADAAVSDVPGAVLTVLTADCLPVLFAAHDGSEVGIAHAGWRGLAAGVLEATVSAMRSSPDQISAWFGPAAGPSRYEIGDEVRAAFVDSDPAAASCFTATCPSHQLIDLYALARRRLASVGVTAVSGGELCTISDASRFYSYRRDGRTGRMASLIWIEG